MMTDVVPPLKQYYATPRDMRSAEQRTYYDRFRTSVRAGSPLALDEQWSYGFALISELATSTRRPRDEWGNSAFDYRLPEAQEAVLADALALLRDHFPGSPLSAYSERWLAGLFFLDGRFKDGYLAFRSAHVPLDLYVTLGRYVEEPRISVQTAKYWLGAARRTSKPITHPASVVDAEMQTALDAYHEQHGSSVIEDLWKRWFASTRTRLPLEVDPIEFGKHLSKDRLAETVAYHDTMEPNWPRPFQAFEASGYRLNKIEWPVPYCRTYHFSQIAKARLAAMLEEAEARAAEARDAKETV